MADNTIVQQGRFTSDGTPKIIQLRSDVDWMRVYNITVAAANQDDAIGVEYYWQRGFPADAAIEYKKSEAAAAADLTEYITTGGFTLIDSSAQSLGAATALAGIDNGTPPVVTVASTAALYDGDIVRLINVDGGLQVSGMDFTIDVIDGTTFSLPFMAQIVAANAGTYRVVKFDPLFYPRRRFVTAITQAASAVVTFSVTHGYTVGQTLRFQVDPAYGMSEINGLSGVITAVSTANNTVTVDIDTTGFTAFAFPVTADVPFTHAYTAPVGEDTAAALTAGTDILGDATINEGYIGMKLASGTDSPAGNNNDVIYWVAGKSFSVNNE